MGGGGGGVESRGDECLVFLHVWNSSDALCYVEISSLPSWCPVARMRSITWLPHSTERCVFCHGACLFTPLNLDGLCVIFSLLCIVLSLQLRWPPTPHPTVSLQYIPIASEKWITQTKPLPVRPPSLWHCNKCTSVAEPIAWLWYCTWEKDASVHGTYCSQCLSLPFQILF